MKLLPDLFGCPQVDLHSLDKKRGGGVVDKVRTSTRRYRFVDLFCGAGAFHQAFKGHDCVLACDIMNHVKMVYEYNYPGTPFVFDVYKIDSKILPNHDIICAGFPCQAFSHAGWQRGFEDKRGVLFFEIMRLAKIHKTKVLLLENVPGLINHDKCRTYQVILRELWDAGYEVYHKILGAHTHGNIPQMRRRLFIVAFYKDKVKNHSEFRFPCRIKLTKTVKDLLLPDHEIPSKYWVEEGSKLWIDVNKVNFEPYILYRYMFSKWLRREGKLARTFCANDGQGNLRYKSSHVMFKNADGKYRALVPREYLRFMGFPDDFKIPPGTKDYVPNKMAGNSIVVPVATRIANNILHVLDKCEDIVEEEVSKTSLTTTIKYDSLFAF